MKYGMDELLKNTYHQGDVPTDDVNRTVLRMIRESDKMEQTGEKRMRHIRQRQERVKTDGKTITDFEELPQWQPYLLW